MFCATYQSTAAVLLGDIFYRILPWCIHYQLLLEIQFRFTLPVSEKKFFGFFVCSRIQIVLVGKELIYLHFLFFFIFFFFSLTSQFFFFSCCFVAFDLLHWRTCSTLCTLKFCIFKPRLFVTFLKCQSYYI